MREGLLYLFMRESYLAENLYLLAEDTSVSEITTKKNKNGMTEQRNQPVAGLSCSISAQSDRDEIETKFK